MSKLYQELKHFYKTYISRILLTGRQKRRYGHIGHNSEIYKPVRHDRYKNWMSLGENSIIMSGSRIQFFPQPGKDHPKLKIGNNNYFLYNLTILVGENITIGDNVVIASNVFISSEGHGTDPESGVPYKDQPLRCKPVVIGSGCWLGENAVILPGVSVGENAIIGAGSIVTKDVDSYSVVGGNPAKVIKRYDFELHEWVSVLRKEML